MQTFILFTRLVSEEVHPSFSIEEKSQTTKKKVAEHCPLVSWTGNYVTMGPWNYIDIFQAPDIETAMKVAMLVRLHGGACTEVWPALEWEAFKDTMGFLKA